MTHALPPLPRPRRRHPLVVALRSVWTAPTTAIGHLAGLFVARGVPPRRVSGPLAEATFYPIRRPGLAFFGAVTLGHVVLIHDRAYRGRNGRIVMAHELAHTRQHDVLGPFYLPLHGLAQLVSAAISLVRPRGRSAVHTYNPLEQTWIAFSFDAIEVAAAWPEARDAELEGFLAAWGVGSSVSSGSSTDTPFGSIRASATRS
ncbi:MAG: DUF4157 domain-containing protein [Polyangiales bacterium]